MLGVHKKIQRTQKDAPLLTVNLSNTLAHRPLRCAACEQVRSTGRVPRE